MAYLGLFSRIFNWVLERIFEPVFEFVAGLLSTVFTWIFNEILAPILMPILEAALEFFIDLWLQIYSLFIYGLFSGVLKLIDYLQTAFDVFIGLTDVSYVDHGVRTTGTLVEVLMQNKTVSTVFWVITCGALALALLLTVYATAQSAFDLDFENKRPVSKVLTSMMKTFIRFFTVPFLVYFMLKLSSVILRGVSTALTSGNGGTSLGRILFMIASLDAAKNDQYNISTASASANIGATDAIRAPFYNLTGGKDYANVKEVIEYFDLAKFDYLIGFIAAVFLLFTIGICLIIFVQRIFELILLYIVSPYFVCTMPLDDGEKYSKWQELFIGKCFTGFGSAIGMRLYLMICPMVMGNSLTFGTNSSPEMDYIMKLFFLAGGAWAVYKSGSMITSLISFQAGSSEQTTAALAGGLMYSYTVGKAMSAGKSLVGKGVNKAAASAFGPKHQKDGEGIRNQAYTGDKLNVARAGMGRPGIGRPGLHVPPNKPLPPTPHKAPNKPLPPIPRKVPNKPLPPTPHKAPNKPLPPTPHKGPGKPLPPIPGQVSSMRRRSISGGERLQISTGSSLNTLAARRASWSAGSQGLSGSRGFSGSHGSVGEDRKTSGLDFATGSVSRAAEYGGPDTGRFKGDDAGRWISATRADERPVVSVTIGNHRDPFYMESSSASVGVSGTSGSIGNSGSRNDSFRSRVPHSRITPSRQGSTGQFTRRQDK